MSKEKFESKQNLEEQNIERQHFDIPHKQEALSEDSEDMRKNAVNMLKLGIGTLDYERSGDKIFSVTVKDAVGEVIFFSREPEDIEVFLETEIAE